MSDPVKLLKFFVVKFFVALPRSIHWFDPLTLFRIVYRQLKFSIQFLSLGSPMITYLFSLRCLCCLQLFTIVLICSNVESSNFLHDAVLKKSTNLVALIRPFSPIFYWNIYQVISYIIWTIEMYLPFQSYSTNNDIYICRLQSLVKSD